MPARTAFTDISGVAYDAPARGRPSLRVLHSLPEHVRRQVRLADEPAVVEALTILPDCDAPALHWGATHEVMGWGADRFALNALAQAHGLSSAHPFVWVGRPRDVWTLRPEGLAPWIPPAALTLVEAKRRADILWAAEQVLRAPAQAVCVVQLDMGPRLSESRRLQVAAEAGGALGLVLVARRANSSTCQTRWSCEAGGAAPGARARWSLLKNKSGQLGAWDCP